jgi:cytosine/adenosine deaminase-related metal-dependent hydrolase
MQGGRGDVTLDPEPFWAARLQFDRDGDGRIGRDEITVVQTGDAFAIAHPADFKAVVVAPPAIDAHSLYVRTDMALLAFC